MAQLVTATENKFTKGLVTEYTGLNFPENAMTDADNTEVTVIGDVVRRLGLDFEVNSVKETINIVDRSVNTYRWNNAGGDGLTQLLAVQVGSTIQFYDIDASTLETPLSNLKLFQTVDLTDFEIDAFDRTVQCEFADGNGYLFVFHPNIDPIYCSFIPNTGVFATPISIQIRDFAGIPEPNVGVTDRPVTLTASHSYNLANQGWTTDAAWRAVTTIEYPAPALGSRVYNVGTVTGINLGDSVAFYSHETYWYEGGPVLYGSGYAQGSGTVTAYADPLLTINVQGTNGVAGTFIFTIAESNLGFVDAWNTSQGNYPSNADVWWYFKNASGVFDPTTQVNTSLSTGNAPQGHFIVNAFNIDRATSGGVPGLTAVRTTKRPQIGAWFQGRLWYSGVSAAQIPIAEEPFYSWTENIYFSQINVGTASNFGNCFQTNDPTSENLNDLLPTDGGVIQIQSCGRIFKLFPTVNGLLVFAANGVWYITGSQGIGFAANDYTITKISGVQSISSTSYVDVLGLPYFWTEEGIYAVETDQQGRLAVNILTHDTIDSFYAEIPKEARKYARGSYNHIDYVIQWIYKSSDSTDVTDKYKFDRALNYNTHLKAFYPYTFDTSLGSIHSVNFLTGPGGANTPDPTFKYFASTGTDTAFADLHDSTYADWASAGGVDFDDKSYFITGYRVHGKANMKFQVPYIFVYSRTDDVVSYKVQSIWDYAISSSANRWSSAQLVLHGNPHYSVFHKKIPLRGRGYAMQLKFKSVVGKAFDFIGWSTFESINQGV
jgi:hypothetical protein